MKSIMELFKGDAVKFFGIDKRVVSNTRTELSEIYVQKNINDWILETDDGMLLHFEFQCTYDVEDLYRFMVSDAIMCFKFKKPVKTMVVYSAEIEDTITTLDIGAIQYNVDAFYMVKLDGDKAYADVKAKIETGKRITKQDIMNIVFLPLMKTGEDRVAKLEQAIMLSKELKTADEQLQIQAMIGMLAEKFVSDEDVLQRLKGLINMGAIAEMIREDARKDAIKEYSVEIARSMLKDDMVGIDFISKHTGLDIDTVKQLQAEMKQGK